MTASMRGAIGLTPSALHALYMGICSTLEPVEVNLVWLFLGWKATCKFIIKAQKLNGRLSGARIDRERADEKEIMTKHDGKMF